MHRRTNGEDFPAEVLLSAFRYGEETVLEATVRDITERKKVEQQLRKLSRAVEHSPASVVITDRHGSIEYVNSKFVEVTGYTAEEAVGQNPRILNARTQPPEFYRELWETLSAGNEWRGEFCNRKKDGEVFWEHASISPIRNAEDETTHYVAVKEDVTDRKKAEEQLQQAKEAAEGATRAKSAFLANMSHEIRTPMNAILGYAQLLRRIPGIPSDARGHLETINQSGEHLLALINDILEMSKIEAGRTELRAEVFDLQGLLQDVERMFRLRTDAKALRLAIEHVRSIPRHVLADEGKVRQVLINIVSNAVKFTDQGGITVRALADQARDGKSRIVIEVEDSGCGIAPNELDKVFSAFDQTEGGRQLGGGTGLGMPISRAFARMMGGDVTVTSKLGQGSVFRFEFVVELAEKSEAPRAAPERTVTGLAIGEPERRILVVDNRYENRDLLIRLLTQVGFIAREARNGREALRAVEEWRPHLVLMDVRMPVMDGEEATRRIKAMPEDKRIPVLMVTASAMDDSRDRSLQAGADGFISKPFREAHIFSEIARCLGVEYTYAEEPTPEEDKSEIVLSPDQVAGLPEALLDELRKVTSSADMDRLNELIDQIGQHDPAVAEGLRKLADQFEYEALLRVLGIEDIE